MSCTESTSSLACGFCPDKRIFSTANGLWDHARADHADRFPSDGEELHYFPKDFGADFLQKRPSLLRDEATRNPNLNEDNRAQPEPGGDMKHPFSAPKPQTRPLSNPGVSALNLGLRAPDLDVEIQDETPDTIDISRKRTAIGVGISASSASPFRESSASPPPRHSKARPTSASYTTNTPSSDPDIRGSNMFDVHSPQPGNKKLWIEQDAPKPRSCFVDPKNIASVQAQKSRVQALTKGRKSYNPLLGNNAKLKAPTAKEETYNIILQPETRPISQEQLVAKIKGIYAGLVMVEAKCIEVDNKQATLAQADPSGQSKLNNEQWQALISLHRALLHEHHDFFLASQHPSASPALRRLAAKYEILARMRRHNIKPFLDTLRHRLPFSLDHVLAFFYLADSMIALSCETAPDFDDSWAECLRDLQKYRMAMEDDDILHREVWTKIATHWDMDSGALTKGHDHAVMLAQLNSLQQLFKDLKLVCVEISSTAVKDSILTLFRQILFNDHCGLSDLITTFIKTHRISRTSLKERFVLQNLFWFKIYFLDLWFARVDSVGDPWAEMNLGVIEQSCIQRLSKTCSSLCAPKFKLKKTLISGVLDLSGFEEKVGLDALEVKDSCPSSQDRVQAVVTVTGRLTSNIASKLGAVFGCWKATLVPLLLLSQLSHAHALAAGPRASKVDVFVEKWEYGWSEFVENYSAPTIILFLESCGLYLMFRLIVWLDGRLKNQLEKSKGVKIPNADLEALTKVQRAESHTLLCWKVVMSGCVFFLGRDDRIATYVLIPPWFLSFALNVEYMRQRLLPFSKSAGEAFLSIITLATGSAGAFAYRSAPIEGRCSDWVTYTAFAFLPAMAFYGGGWVASIRNSGRARLIETTFDIEVVHAEGPRSMKAGKLAVPRKPKSDAAADTQLLKPMARSSRHRTRYRKYSYPSPTKANPDLCQQTPQRGVSS